MPARGSEALSLFEGEGWVRVVDSVQLGRAVPLAPTLSPCGGEGAAR
jgi:hypothetical protein